MWVPSWVHYWPLPHIGVDVTPILIALYSSGPSSGKSEVASFLTKDHGFEVIKLADTIKLMVDMLLVSLGVPVWELRRYREGDLKEVVIPQLGKTPRYLYQTLGTEWGRELVKPTIWTDLCIGRCRRRMESGYSVVVDDMRFPNEFEALERAGATTVRVTRPGVGTPEGHASEGLLDDVLMDYEVVNDGTLEDLARNVSTLVEDLRL